MQIFMIGITKTNFTLHSICDIHHITVIVTMQKI